MFEFDPDKATVNVRKHGVSFADAEGVFLDSLAIHRDDADGDYDEERYVALGMNNIGQLLVVVYTLRDDNVRLISARRATRRERKQYESGI